MSVLRVLQEYVAYYNTVRPHHGLAQRVPDAAESALPRVERAGRVRAVPILGGLHHVYQRAA